MRANDIPRLIVVALTVSMIAGWPGPVSWAERRVAPVVKDMGLTDVHRDPFLACWTWRFVKRRAAHLANVEADVMIPDRAVMVDGEAVIIPGRRIDAATLVWEPDGLRYFRTDQTTRPDPAPHSRVVCVDLVRARVHSDEAMRVVFSATYVSWPGLWPTRYTMRDVAVPAFPRP